MRDSGDHPIKREVLEELTARHGLVMGGRDLQQALGYPSPAAFRQAASRGNLPVAVFGMPKRRGRFALTHEVATWIWKCRLGATEPSTACSGETCDAEHIKDC